MAGTFAIPKLTLRKTSSNIDVPIFNWSDVKITENLGTGSFGTVCSGRYTRRTDVVENVVVKQLQVQNRESKRLFLKEARLLHSLQGHENIASFMAFCTEPYAIMMEHVYFDFNPFGIAKKVTCLSELLQFIDDELDFLSLKRFQLEIARGIAEGLCFLHENGIVHRDLKPSNVLVTNQHYVGNQPESDKAARFSESPIKCKLADFGESRATYLQTRTLVETHTHRVDRGTPVFMAPEAHLKPTQSMNQQDLQRADIWSFGMIMFCLLNPNVDHPFQHVLAEAGMTESLDSLKVVLKENRLPKHQPKYEFLQVSEWWQLEQAFSECAKFEPELRPSAPGLRLMFSEDQSSASVKYVMPLAVSQATALCERDEMLAKRLHSNTPAIQDEYEQFVPPDNDGTNACVFLDLAIANHFLTSDEPPLEWGEIKTLAEDVITNFPAVINQLRNTEELYEPIAAYSLMKNNNLMNDCALSEEFTDDQTQRVFSIAGRDHFVRVLAGYALTSSTTVGLYTCDPYTILVGVHRDSLFVVDTHQIDDSLGGNGNGILLHTEDKSESSCARLVQWIHGRLLKSGLGPDSRQSLAWITIDESSNETVVESVSPNVEDGSLETVSINNALGSCLKRMVKTAPAAGNECQEVVEICDDSSSISFEDRENGDFVEIIKSCRRRTEVLPKRKISSSKSSNRKDNFNKSNKLSDNAPDDGGQSSGDDESSSGEEMMIQTFKPSGEPYKEDATTPVFTWNKTAYTSEQLVCILLGAYEPEQLCISQPINVSHNVSFLVDTKSLRHHDDLKCDDMGAWKHNGSPKCAFHVEKDSRGIKRIFPLDRDSNRSSQPPGDDVYELKRTYYKNSSDPDVRKIVSKLYGNSGQQFPLVLVQYLFKSPEHEVKRIMPHGNAKRKSSYKRIFPSTREQLKNSVMDKEKTPKEALDEVYISSGDVTMARSVGELPRGPSDIYNARRSAKQDLGGEIQGNESRTTSVSSETVNVDNVWTLLERAKREEEESKDAIFIRECSIHPDLFIVLANDQQLDELVQFCTNPRSFSVFGIDPTFNIFDRNISLTVTTYRNLKLEQSKTGKPPVFIGPLLMHQRKDWKTYSKFAHSLKTAKPDLEGIQACGTDGEKALIDGFRRNLQFAVFLRCFIHFKENIKRELTSRGISSEAKTNYLTEIFGKQEGTTKYTGLVDSESQDQFDSRLEDLKAEWEERENMNGNKERKQSFFEWFRCEKATEMKESMLKAVRIEAGLGDPPTEYTNNDPESANFMIKHGLHFNASKPHEFVDKIKNIIETQQRNEGRAVFGRGPYRVRKEFEYLTVNDVERSRLNQAQLTKKMLDFKKAGMNEMKDVIASTQPELGEEQTAVRLIITAEESGIKSIPTPILESMFERAANLIGVPGNVIPKPGASDGSYIVAGISNKAHNVEPGKGGSLSCDRSCVNFSTKICEHVLAVAHVKGKLKEFLEWFKRKKKRTQMMDMVEQGGPKTAGKKPSGRKRTNVKRKPIEAYVDLFANEENHTGNWEPSTIPPAPTIPACSSQVQQPRFFASIPSPVTSCSVPQWPSFRYETSASSYPSMANFGSVSTQIPAANPYDPTAFRFSLPVGSPPNVQTISSGISQASCLPASGIFQLKWVHGTTVARCYGCGGDIPNPPRQRPDDLVVVCRDVREYRDRLTGQLQRNSTPQNVHFHLRRECILMRYPTFHVGLLVVSPAFQPLLHQEHINRLSENFGWNNV